MVFGLFFCTGQITEWGSNFNDMQPRFTLANQGIEKFLEWENKKMVIRIVLRYTLVYITDILLVFIQNTAIIKEGIFLSFIIQSQTDFEMVRELTKMADKC